MLRFSRTAVFLVFLIAAVGAGHAQTCPGDCDGDGQVSVAELVRGVRIGLGEAAVGECAAMDFDRDGKPRSAGFARR